MSTTVRNIYKIISIVIFLGIVAFIWNNSLDIAEVSTVKSQGLVETINNAFFNGRVVVTEHFIRKTAHFTEYTLLGASIALIVVSFVIKPIKRHFAFGLVGGAVIAALDEGIQYFTNGRSAQLSDVCLDTVGVLFGLLLSYFIYVLFYRSSCKKSIK